MTLLIPRFRPYSNTLENSSITIWSGSSRYFDSPPEPELSVKCRSPTPKNSAIFFFRVPLIKKITFNLICKNGNATPPNITTAELVLYVAARRNTDEVGLRCYIYDIFLSHYSSPELAVPTFVQSLPLEERCVVFVFCFIQVLLRQLQGRVFGKDFRRYVLHLSSMLTCRFMIVGEFHSLSPVEARIFLACTQSSLMISIDTASG